MSHTQRIEIVADLAHPCIGTMSIFCDGRHIAEWYDGTLVDMTQPDGVPAFPEICDFPTALTTALQYITVLSNQK